MAQQTVQPKRRYVVDSGSTDDTVAIAERHGFQCLRIARADFDHGGTRQAMVDLIDDVEILLFLTQDALLAQPQSLGLLMQPFADDRVAVCFGRQLPREGASATEAHARIYNYPPVSAIRSKSDIRHYGLRAAFCSNSFAAYRRAALFSVGGFPKTQILIEDWVVAAQALLQGWHVAYVSDACVYHSHDYTAAQEFSRYFDIGVAHQQQKELLSKFGPASEEGLRFVKSELRYLLHNQPQAIPNSLLRTLLKLLGFHAGRFHPYLPLTLRKKLSMHKSFWRRESN